MRHSPWPVGGDHDRLGQIEVGHTSVGRRGNLVAQTKIDGQVLQNAPIVLEKLCKIPIARGIQAVQRILLCCLGYTEKQVRGAVSAGGGGKILSKAAAKVHIASRHGELEEVSLLAAKVYAILQRVLAMCLGDAVGNLKDILEDMLGQILRVAHGRFAGDVNVDQPGGVDIPAIRIWNAQLV